MDTGVKEILARLERAVGEIVTALARQEQRLDRQEQLLEGVAGRQKVDGDLLRMVAERQDEIVKLLTPQEKDGPSIDELLGHIIGQMTEMTGYLREIVKGQSKMEQNLPGDVARAVAAGGNGNQGVGGPGVGRGTGGNGGGRGGHP